MHQDALALNQALGWSACSSPSSPFGLIPQKHDQTQHTAQARDHHHCTHRRSNCRWCDCSISVPRLWGHSSSGRNAMVTKCNSCGYSSSSCLYCHTVCIATLTVLAVLPHFLSYLTICTSSLSVLQFIWASLAEGGTCWNFLGPDSSPQHRNGEKIAATTNPISENGNTSRMVITKGRILIQHQQVEQQEPSSACASVSAPSTGVMDV